MTSDVALVFPDCRHPRCLPRSCVVERFFAWIDRNGRLAENFEATSAAFLYAASVMLLVRHLARQS